MKKLGVLLYGLSLSGVTIYGLQAHSYYVSMLFSLDRLFVLFSLLSIAALATYMFLLKARSEAFKDVMLFGGLASMVTGIISVFSPTLGGFFTNYMPFGNTVVLVESGILAVVLALELPVRSNLPNFKLSVLAQPFVYAPKEVKIWQPYIVARVKYIKSLLQRPESSKPVQRVAKMYGLVIHTPP